MLIIAGLSLLTLTTYGVVFLYATTNFFENLPHKSISMKRNIALSVKKTKIRSLEMIPPDVHTLKHDRYIRMGSEVTKEVRAAYERRLRYLLVKEDDNVVPVEMVRREDMEALYELLLLNPDKTYYVTIELIDMFPLTGKRIIDVRYEHEYIPPEYQLDRPEEQDKLN